MNDEKQILSYGLNTNEPPKETLDKLFQLTGICGEKGKAFVGVCYAEENNPNGVYGARIVGKDALSKWNHKVTRTHTGFLHVELVDFVAKYPCYQHPSPKLI